MKYEELEYFLIIIAFKNRCFLSIRIDINFERERSRNQLHHLSKESKKTSTIEYFQTKNLFRITEFLLYSYLIFFDSISILNL